MSELSGGMCCPEKPKDTLAAHFRYLQLSKGCPGAGAMALSDRAAPERKPGSEQVWEGVELTEHRFLLRVWPLGHQAMDCRTGVCPPGAVWDMTGQLAGGQQQQFR